MSKVAASTPATVFDLELLKKAKQEVVLAIHMQKVGFDKMSACEAIVATLLSKMGPFDNDSTSEDG